MKHFAKITLTVLGLAAIAVALSSIPAQAGGPSVSFTRPHRGKSGLRAATGCRRADEVRAGPGDKTI